MKDDKPTHLRLQINVVTNGFLVHCNDDPSQDRRSLPFVFANLNTLKAFIDQQVNELAIPEQLQT